MNKMTPDPAYRLLSSLSNKLILFGSHYGSPCRRNSRKNSTPRTSTNKKRRLVEKVLTKKKDVKKVDRKMEDIRKFWKKKNEEDLRSGMLENEHRPSNKLENNEVTHESGIKKLENTRYIAGKKLDKCEFDNMRMCIEHRCVAEKISVKVSKYKKSIGFVKETVIKLRCTGSRNCGPVVPENSAVHLYPCSTRP